jgi:FkbM family methyltransferase
MGLLSGIKSAIERDWPQVYALTLKYRDDIALSRGERELRLLPALVDPTRPCIDVGANNGLYTYALLQLGAPRIVAFEPNPKMAAILKLRFERHVRSGRLVVETKGLSTERGQVDLFIPEGAHALASLEPRAAQNQEKITVEIVPMDELDVPRVGFIKIDVEGHEGAVLEGGRNLIARERPNILVEAEERHQAGAVRRARNVLEPLGYAGFFLGPDGLTPATQFDPAIHQKESALDASGRHKLPGALYVNNFMFVRDEAAAEKLKAAATAL